MSGPNASLSRCDVSDRVRATRSEARPSKRDAGGGREACVKRQAGVRELGVGQIWSDFDQMWDDFDQSWTEFDQHWRHSANLADFTSNLDWLDKIWADAAQSWSSLTKVGRLRPDLADFDQIWAVHHARPAVGRIRTDFGKCQPLVGKLSRLRPTLADSVKRLTQCGPKSTKDGPMCTKYLVGVGQIRTDIDFISADFHQVRADVAHIGVVFD